MGFMDKMKEQAAVVTAVAKDTAQKGQAKVEEVQAQRTADEVLRQIGLAVFLEKTGRGSDDAASVIDDHVATLRDYEKEHGPLSAAPAAEDEAG